MIDRKLNQFIATYKNTIPIITKSHPINWQQNDRLCMRLRWGNDGSWRNTKYLYIIWDSLNLLYVNIKQNIYYELNLSKKNDEFMLIKIRYTFKNYQHPMHYQHCSSISSNKFMHQILFKSDKKNEKK